MRKIVTTLFLFFAVAFHACLVSAAPAWPRKMTYTQPDGTEVTVYLRGDEYSHWHEAEDGAVLLRGADGVLCYAVLGEDGKAVPSGVAAVNVAGRSAEAVALVAGQDMAAVRRSLRMEADKAGKTGGRVAPETITRTFPTTGEVTPTTGEVTGLVILAEYQDVKFAEGHTRDVYDELSNADGYAGEYASFSVRDYFVAQSYGKFTPRFDVVGPVTLPHDMKYYGAAELAPEMIIDACNEAKAKLGTDFSKYDANGDGNVDFVFVIYAGYGESQGGPAESVWPQKVDLTYSSWKTYDGLYLADAACSCELRGYEGADMDGIGTFCHEFSHILGLPDVYDTGAGGSGFGMSDWDAMDHGIYLDNSRTPAGYTAMDKFSVGWITPKVLTEPASDLELRPLSETEDAYFIVCEGNGREYYTLENRQKTGCDKALPGHGMIISHVHYVPALWSSNRVNASDNEYEHISLVAADNNKSSATFAGDPFPGSGNVTSFTDDTTPAASWHTSDAKVNSPVTNIRERDGVILFDFKGGATAVTDVSADCSFSLRAGEGFLDVRNPLGGEVVVTSADGRQVSRSSSENQRIALGRGMYIVSGGGQSEKVIVK